MDINIEWGNKIIKIMAEFVVKSGGVCFLCFEHIPFYMPTPCKFEPESYSTPLYSLQTLSRYLKLNTRKAFEPPHQFRNKYKVRVELCKDCVCLTEQFTRLCQQLEKIEMEVSSHLNLIYDKLLQSSKRGDSGHNENGKFPLKNQKIVERLRTQAIQKCSHRLKSTLPRVKVPKLTKTEEKHVRNQMKKAQLLQSNARSTRMVKEDPVILEHLPDPDIDIGRIKIERSCPTSPDAPEDDLEYNDEIISEQFDLIATELIKGVSKKSISPSRKQCSRPAVTKASRKISSKDPVAEQYKCNLCSERFPKLRQLSSHHRKCHTNKYLKCSFCGVEFSKQHSCRLQHQHRQGSFTKRSRKKLTKGALKCSVCGEQFNSNSSRSRHYKMVHIGIQFKCQFCNKEFAERYGLTRHIKEGSCHLEDAARFICSCRYCKKGFARVANFEKHFVIHHLSRSEHKCDLCGKKFVTQDCLKRHQFFLHSITPIEG